MFTTAKVHPQLIGKRGTDTTIRCSLPGILQVVSKTKRDISYLPSPYPHAHFEPILQPVSGIMVSGLDCDASSQGTPPQSQASLPGRAPPRELQPLHPDPNTTPHARASFPSPSRDMARSQARGPSSLKNSMGWADLAQFPGDGSRLQRVSKSLSGLPEIGEPFVQHEIRISPVAGIPNQLWTNRFS